MAAETVSELVTGAPPAALRGLVACYRGYEMRGFAPGEHRGLPSPRLTWIISLDEPVDIAAMPDPRRRPQRLTAFVSGMHVGPALIRHGGTQHGLSLDLTPAGARALFGVPAAELADAGVVDLADLAGRAGAELVERVHDARGWGERFAALDAFLLARAGDPATPPALDGAWRRVLASGGAIPVAALADEVGYSRRQLTERFTREYGLGPKAMARVVRFARARELIARRRDLAATAVACGYFDQAHLNREFRELAGCTPTRWLAEELPNVQDDARTLAA